MNQSWCRRGGAAVDGSAGGCALYAATRVVIAFPANAELGLATGFTWVEPSVAPPLVRGAFELPCDVASITFSLVMPS